jgi:LysM repeat protein
MKKLFSGLFVFIILFASAHAQLMARNDDKGLHLDHTVAAKEGFFAIARLYNVHPKFLAAYNNLDINKGINIGQVIHIPLTDTNFSQKANTGKPVYYRVGEKEGLLKVSNANNKVTMQRLREWNKLANDNVTAGSKLIVGFLIPAETPAVAVSVPVKEEPKQVKDDKPVVKAEKTTDKSVVKEELTKAEQDKEKQAVKEPAKKAPPVAAKQEVTANMMGQGYFKASFDQQVKQIPVSKTETVTSGIFKTTNGLQDAKYYLLINGVIPGTIIRIINPENNKTVYAKVLGEMNGIRQNQGLDMRISNSAAETLGINEMDKFIVKVNY